MKLKSTGAASPFTRAMLLKSFVILIHLRFPGLPLLYQTWDKFTYTAISFCNSRPAGQTPRLQDLPGPGEGRGQGQRQGRHGADGEAEEGPEGPLRGRVRHLEQGGGGEEETVGRGEEEEAGRVPPKISRTKDHVMSSPSAGSD